MNTPQTPIAQRSVGPQHPRLTQPICLRCAKHQGDPAFGACDVDVAFLRRCSWCTAQRAHCFAVPPEFNRRLNGIFVLQREYLRKLTDPTLPGDEPEVQARRLHDIGKVWTKDVEAFLRKKARHGLTHRPASQVEATMIQTAQTARVANALEGILDVLRHQSNLAPIVHGDDDSSSGNEAAPSQEHNDDALLGFENIAHENDEDHAGELDNLFVVSGLVAALSLLLLCKPQFAAPPGLTVVFWRRVLCQESALLAAVP